MKKVKEIVRKVISWLATGILVVSVLLCLVASVNIVRNGEKSILGFSWFYIVSGSMGDSVPVNSFVITHKQKSYAVQDVITFSSQNPEIAGNPNTHRIVDTKSVDGAVYYQTQGDANVSPDYEWITNDVIYGKVVFVGGKSDWFGALLGFLMTPGGFMTLILIPLALITVPILRDEARKLKKLAEEAKEKQE